ncbi:hypothetical protein GCM10012276_01870 [Nocardioides deserti]|nr:hypothetical protein GCM10012276_01870 [Nocardioides deserti]
MFRDLHRGVCRSDESAPEVLHELTPRRGFRDRSELAESPHCLSEVQLQRLLIRERSPSDPVGTGMPLTMEDHEPSRHEGPANVALDRVGQWVHVDEPRAGISPERVYRSVTPACRESHRTNAKQAAVLPQERVEPGGR